MKIKSGDVIIEETLSAPWKMFHERELKDAVGPSFEFRMEATVAGGQEKIDCSSSENRASFMQNLRYWNNQTQFLANNDFSNSYFRSIVDMGLDAVPLILEEIKKSPSFLVHALDEILPGVVEYGDGYIPVEKACETWISILSPIDGI